MSWVSIAAAVGDAGRESPFSLGAGGRGMAMGRAFVSLAGDASATFWNPGATAAIDRTEFMAFHTSLFMGTNYDCLALAHPVGTLGVFSVSAGRLGTGDIQERDIYNRPLRTLSSSESQLGLTYGRTVGFGLAAGLTLKGVAVEVGDNAGYGFGADLGFQYMPTMINGLILGASFNDLYQPRVKLINQQDIYQTVSAFGISYSRNISNVFNSTVVSEVEKISGRKARFGAGIEAAFYKRYFLRFGYDRDRPTFGAGITYDVLKLDYAYENIQYFGGTHRISLGFSFGPSVRKTQEETRATIVEEEKASWEASLDKQRKAEFKSYMATADSLRNDRRYQDAMGYYERAFALDGTSIRARAMSDSMINTVIADAVFSTRDQKREDLISRRITSGLQDFKAGLFNDAISQYELALEIDPGNRTVTDLLESTRSARATEIAKRRKNARAYRDGGDFPSAILEWNRVLVLEPSDAEAKTGVDQSRNQLKANALVASAVDAMNNGKYSDAVTYLQQAQDIRPRDNAIKSMLAQARARSAPATNLEDIKESSDHWSVYLKGLESYQAGDYDSAIRSWESLREFYPNNPDLEKNISQARQRLTTEGGKSQE